MVTGGSYAPSYQFEKREIHKVFLHFPNFNLEQNLSPISHANLNCGYVGGGLRMGNVDCREVAFFPAILFLEGKSKNEKEFDH